MSIISRCDLGALPAKFSRLEQAPPDDWAQVPPDLIHCPTIPVSAIPTGGIAESKGVACNTYPFQTLDEKLYAKKPKIPAGSNWAESIVSLYDAFYAAAPEEWREATIKEAVGSGGFTHQGLLTPPHYLQEACQIDTIIETETFAADQGAFVLSSGGANWDLKVVKEVPGTGDPNTPANYAWHIDYLETAHNEEFSEDSTAPEAPAPELPPQIDWSSGTISVRGLQRPDSNSREKASWYWKITSESIYSEDDWPVDRFGDPVTLVGAVRWTVTERERPVTDEGTGAWIEVSTTPFSEEFSLSPESDWEGVVHTLDESGRSDTEVEQSVSSAAVMVKYPSAVFDDPDYSGFPYI